MAPKEKDKICLDAGYWIEVEEARSIAEVPSYPRGAYAWGDEVTNIRERYDKFEALKKVTAANDLTAKQRAENEAYIEAWREQPHFGGLTLPHPAHTTYVARHEFDAYMKWKGDEDFRLRVEKVVEAMDKAARKEREPFASTPTDIFFVSVLLVAVAMFALALVVF